nr:response regulator [Lachnospiraceae bacterium]
AGLRLSGQIEDIQDYSEIQRGDVILEEEKYMITSLLNDIISNYQVAKPDKNVDLIVDLDPNVPAMMRGDAGKISRIILHLLDNAFKFTDLGGVYLKVSSIKRDYGVNLIIEVTDTGKGMGRSDIDKISKGLYQANTKRNRNNGGIGLGLSIVYGFVRKMNGFVNIESRKDEGTTVRVSLAQSVIDPSACLSVDREEYSSIAFHVMPEKYETSKVRDFYRLMASTMASGLRMNLYSAPDRAELDRLIQRGDITHIFMGQEEYEESPEYFDELSDNGMIVAVSAKEGFKVSAGSSVIVMPKPLYGCPVVRVINGDVSRSLMPGNEEERRPVLEGVRALVVDDEPMNLVVATGIFREYKMLIDTAASGKEAIEKYKKNEYDIVFMDHMMPEMDGVEAMKHLKEVAADQGRVLRIIALTANAISGAREMFLREGFDEFISKPIHINEFERTVSKVIPSSNGRKGNRV